LTDHFVANSEAVRQDVLREEKLPPDKVTVIYNGLSVFHEADARSEALRAALEITGANPIIAVVANFHGYKGYQFFFDALEPIARAYPDLVALLVGDGPMRQHFEEDVRARGLQSSVRFLGARADVPAVLGIADVIVHPSTQEGFSNAVLEAMAAGKPVVAAAVGGNPEAILHGETGLLVPPCNGAALADATIWLLCHADEARAMGRAGRQRVAHTFGVAAGSDVRRGSEHQVAGARS
jgi:glycosyltransferase involved in cell wall biosynthesis